MSLSLRYRFLGLAIAALTVPGCGGDRPVVFDNVTRSSGLVDAPTSVEAAWGSVAVGDYDGDGDEDLFVVGDRDSGVALFRNNDDGRFDDVTEAAGLSLPERANGGVFVDYDNDGDQDLFVTAWGPNLLFRNSGGVFEEVGAEAGLRGDAADGSTMAVFGDLDFDGDLDLYVVNHHEVAAEPSEGSPARSDRLYRNEGDGTFTDVTLESGVGSGDSRYGVAVSISDLDNDRDLDIYVTHDGGGNRLWRNDNDLQFVDAESDAASVNVVVAAAPAGVDCGTGVDAADTDGDGRFDLLIGGCAGSSTRLFRNAAAGPLELRFEPAPFPETESARPAYATEIFDYDNDGRPDVFIAAGPRLYRQESTGEFVDTTAISGLSDAARGAGRSAAVADLDRNGALDLIVLSRAGPPALWLNPGARREHWLSIELVGKNANRDGIGARLELTVNGRTLVREVNPYGSFRSQGSSRVHFGMGSHRRTDQLVVHWPSGHTDLITGLEAGLFYTVEEQVGVVAEAGPGGW